MNNCQLKILSHTYANSYLRNMYLANILPKQLGILLDKIESLVGAFVIRSKLPPKMFHISKVTLKFMHNLVI